MQVASAAKRNCQNPKGKRPRELAMSCLEAAARGGDRGGCGRWHQPLLEESGPEAATGASAFLGLLYQFVQPSRSLRDFP